MPRDHEMNVHAFFAKITELQDDEMKHTEYLHSTYDFSTMTKN